VPEPFLEFSCRKCWSPGIEIMKRLCSPLRSPVHLLAAEGGFLGSFSSHPAPASVASIKHIMWSPFLRYLSQRVLSATFSGSNALPPRAGANSGGLNKGGAPEGSTPKILGESAGLSLTAKEATATMTPEAIRSLIFGIAAISWV
jgi:hypothetical protein